MLRDLVSKLSVYLRGALPGLGIGCHSLTDWFDVFSMIDVIRVGEFVYVCPLNMSSNCWQERKILCNKTNIIAYTMYTPHQYILSVISGMTRNYCEAGFYNIEVIQHFCGFISIRISFPLKKPYRKPKEYKYTASTAKDFLNKISDIVASKARKLIMPILPQKRPNILSSPVQRFLDKSSLVVIDEEPNTIKELCTTCWSCIYIK